MKRFFLSILVMMIWSCSALCESVDISVFEQLQGRYDVYFQDDGSVGSVNIWDEDNYSVGEASIYPRLIGTNISGSQAYKYVIVFALPDASIDKITGVTIETDEYRYEIVENSPYSYTLIEIGLNGLDMIKDICESTGPISIQFVGTETSFYMSEAQICALRDFRSAFINSGMYRVDSRRLTIVDLLIDPIERWLRD